MGTGIIENINSSQHDLAEVKGPQPTLDELCAATLKRRSKRGRPKGTGRKHPENCLPKTFRYFSPLAHALLAAIHLGDPDLMQQSDAELVEDALVRMARSLSNQNPFLARLLERAGR
jgi:hypothetical protein